MTYEFQVAVDCVDPHVQADWWAETLGWLVEPTDQGFIQSMIDQGFATEADTRVHKGALVWVAGAAIRKPDEDGKMGSERVLFQTAPESKSVKNRIHLDLRLDGEDKSEVRARLERRGATFLWEANQGPHSWYTMADPEGNEFCIG